MKIEGKCTCEECGKVFEWEHQVSQSMHSGSLDAECISKDKAKLYRVLKKVEKNGYLIPVQADIYCPECESLNRINIE